MKSRPTLPVAILRGTLILASATIPALAGVGASRIAPADEAEPLSRSDFEQIAWVARHSSNPEWLATAKARLEALGKNLILVSAEAEPGPDGDLCEVTLFTEHAELKKAWRAVVARLHQLKQQGANPVSPEPAG